LLRELPDREEWAEHEKWMNCHLEHVAAFFFRANQQRISGFVLVPWLVCRLCWFIHDTYFPVKVSGRYDNDHQIYATRDYRQGGPRAGIRRGRYLRIVFGSGPARIF